MAKNTHHLRVHKARNLAFVEIEGRRIYLGKAGTRDASIAYHRVMLEHLGEEDVPQRSAIIAELCRDYAKWAEGYYVKDDGSPTSQQHIIRSALRRLIQQGETIAIQDYGSRRFGDLRDAMLEEGLAARTVQQYMTVLRGVFKWGAEMEIVPPDIYHGLQAVRGPRTRGAQPRPIPLADINAIRPHVRRQVWAMIQVQLLTGARPGEVVMLRPCDIDAAGDVWVAIVADHKNEWRGDSRTLYIGPNAQAVLRPWMLRAAQAYLFDPREAQQNGVGRHPGQKATPRKTARRVGDHYTVGSYRRTITRACRTAEVTVWSPHQLRHTAGTRIRAAYGVEGAQVALGHKHADVTQIYAERNAALAMEIALKMG